ncbi:MAG: VanW family protein [Lachnotalea sp.]
MKIKKFLVTFVCFLAVLTVAAGFGISSLAATETEDNTINEGVYIAGIDVSGMTAEEASAEIDSYLSELGSKEITLMIDTNPVQVTASELGMECTNKDIVDDAINLGKTGNIIQRYKALKDLAHESKEYDLDITFDDDAITNIINDKCLAFNVDPMDASLKRENGNFIITDGQNGIGIDVNESIKAVENALADWNREDTSIDLAVKVVEPEVTKDDYSKVKDVLSTFTTSFTSSGTSRSANIVNGAKLINGSILLPGETFSTYKAITPFTAENGYYLAGSYLQGQVVDSFGGGICQVSTTLYNTVLRAELQVEERHNHSMIVGYVDPSADAAISESAGKDFTFVNTTEYPIYIESATGGKKITFTIYGCETRAANRTIEYKSETLTTTEPVGYNYVIDNTLLFGEQKQTQAPHTGYTAKLFKYVYIDGKQTEVQEVNYSSYKAEPAYISVGTSWGDEASVAALTAAVATNDSATVTATIDSLAGVVGMAAAQQAQAAAVAAQQAAQAAAAAAAGQ